MPTDEKDEKKVMEGNWKDYVNHINQKEFDKVYSDMPWYMFPCFIFLSGLMIYLSFFTNILDFYYPNHSWLIIDLISNGLMVSIKYIITPMVGLLGFLFLLILPFYLFDKPEKL